MIDSLYILNIRYTSYDTFINRLLHNKKYYLLTYLKKVFQLNEFYNDHK